MSSTSADESTAHRDEHHRLHVFAAIARVIDAAGLSAGSPADLDEQWPFLEGYRDALSDLGNEDLPGAIVALERRASGHLPIRALREAARLDDESMRLLFAIGLIEEDARFGLLFESLQTAPLVRRPTASLLNAFFREPVDRGEVRARLRRLLALGLVEVTNPDAPRVEQAFQVPGPIWDALRGEAVETIAGWAQYKPRTESHGADGLVLPQGIRDKLPALMRLLAGGEARTLVVRGASRNGRRTLALALARMLGKGALEISGLDKQGDVRWKLVGPLGTLLDAVPVVVFDPGPGEIVDLPALGAYDGPVIVVLGKHGGLGGPGAERALAVTIDTPNPAARAQHWEAALGASPELSAIAQAYRLTSGNIRRAAVLARAEAMLAGREQVALADVRAAMRALGRQALETLAVRLDPGGTWEHLATSAETQEELRTLERRCKNRERLGARTGPALRDRLNAGVRALFQGPSGTGKTMAARILAGALGMDLYRVDLAAIVSKYIGETEKNLGKIFALAEELDVVLLFDEGDALMTQRTSVQTSNDRYANLETNYLLQRIEAFEGILLVTTNAPESIDGAFARRMDVVVDFRLPEHDERMRIWQVHLPEEHAVSEAALLEVAARCNLTGGQIRNTVLHAVLLALDEGEAVQAKHLEAAIVREYRKAGGASPLVRSLAAIEEEN